MQQRPQSQSIDQGKWRDVSIEHDQITIKGGFNRKGELADALQYQCADNTTHTFVALQKEALWFVKGVGGAKKGDLKAVNVLQMIRQEACAADYVPTDDGEPSPAVAGGDSQSSIADAIGDDPMEAMISIDDVAESIGAVVKKTHKKRKVDRSCLQELTVPTRPACIGAASLQETTIVVYTPREKRKNAVPHLRSDCISWLLSYAADELACQGVSCRAVDTEGTPQKPNCAVENVVLQWNFTYKRWEAIFLAGHAQGETISFRANDVTPALLKQLRALDLVTWWYSKSSASTNKLAAKEYILVWCKAIHDGRVAEHNAKFQHLLRGSSTTTEKTDSAESAAEGDDATDGADLAADDNSDGEESDVAAEEPSAVAAHG